MKTFIYSLDWRGKGHNLALAMKADFMLIFDTWR